MTHEQIEESIPLYASGALERADRQLVEAHLLTGCATCRVLMKDYQHVAGILPYGLAPVALPSKPKMMTAIFERAARADQPTHALRRGHGLFESLLAPLVQYQPALSLVLLLLLSAMGLYTWIVRTDMVDRRAQNASALHEALLRTSALQEQMAQQEQSLVTLRAELEQRIGTAGALIEREAELDLLRQEVAKQEQEAGRLRRALSQRDEMLTFLRSAHVKVVSMNGLETAPGAGAFLLYDHDTKKAFFYGFNLPPLPAGKTYQLWAIVDKPVNAGTFGVDPGQKGRAVTKDLPDLSRITKFAVSLEPEGGRPQPTGTILLAGQV
jgi:Anti-sigma-K factor rskA